MTIASCNDDSPGTTAAGERQQNEPTAAVNPLNTLKLTSGANDYCPVPTTTDAWAGFYYSGTGGATLGEQPAARLSDRHVGGGHGPRRSSAS